MKRTQGTARTRTSPRIIPANGRMQSRPRPFAGRPQDTQVLPRIDSSDITQELPRVNPAALPAVYRHTDPVPATAMAGTLPLPNGYLPLPPSAQHANPAAWHDRTHAEDNDLELQTRGRHVLAELTSLPDPALELAAAPARIQAIKALDGFEPQVKDPGRRLSVRLFRAARDMARSRKRWCDEADVRLRAQDARIAQFAQRWQHDDAHWDMVAARLKAKQDASDAGRITSAYAEGGTSVALCTVEQVAHEIARRALTGSAVSR